MAQKPLQQHNVNLRALGLDQGEREVRACWLLMSCPDRSSHAFSFAAYLCGISLRM